MLGDDGEAIGRTGQDALTRRAVDKADVALAQSHALTEAGVHNGVAVGGEMAFRGLAFGVAARADSPGQARLGASFDLANPHGITITSDASRESLSSKSHVVVVGGPSPAVVSGVGS